MEKNTIIHGKSEEKLKQFPDNIFDSCATDPPYAIGFMNKHWDYQLPSVDLWKEVYRVLKPGAHMLVACGTRTQHRMVCNVEDAGFEVRDVITWHYGSGFPKSMDISKAIDKELGAEREVIGKQNYTVNDKRSGAYASQEATERDRLQLDITASATAEAKAMEGWGTAIKPATEFWTLVRKPLSENTIAANVLKHGTAGLNIDACRIAFENEEDEKSAVWGRGTDILGSNYVGGTHGNGKENIAPNNLGRFPANLVFSHSPECVYMGQATTKSSIGGQNRFSKNAFVRNEDPAIKNTGYGDENGLETIENWQCAHGCPVKMLNEQSGLLKSGQLNPLATEKQNDAVYGNYKQAIVNQFDANQGFASRFFYCAKASTDERNKGLEKLGLVNDHPTVKPVNLMRWLVKLITPKHGLLLDPFAGSGTTCIAAKL
jgi:DNA modification methylase